MNTTFCLFNNETIVDILYEESALNGVKRIANIVSDDLLLVTDRKPRNITNLDECQGNCVIIVATVGYSTWIQTLSERGLLKLDAINGKRESYLLKCIESPFEEYPQIEQALCIVGSDKRGTIYGMFRLSEWCGVSPLVFWGDVAPFKKKEIQLLFDAEIVSKEPTVEYRGFFINDEWPAFGKWCTEHYGGINTSAYEKIFELLLRLKGNYLWPAMWRTSFWEDGPGIENARLADEYGIIMGTSHHEPLCRAGVEWQRQYAKYGDDNTWSFITNSNAITEFWKDGLNRSKDFENVITIGMRGEDDSLLLSKDATVEDNINVLKDAIRVQNQLIKKNVNANLKDTPRMLAIYKEVEDFYFGTNECKGIREWDEIEDVILLLSDDNYGNLRAIPHSNDKPHPGGYGIYYHFDYHGAPYSYEWLNSTNLSKAWEQLTTAYESGIQKMWIVNVGDVKGNEYPLSYFLDLAYDYEKWGISNLNSASEYTTQWVDKQFNNAASKEQKKQIANVLEGYVQWSSVRIPESLNPEVFKNNYFEYEKTFKAVSDIMFKAETLHKELPKQCLSAYESMIYFPVMALLNSLMINLEAGMNHAHANRGTFVANQYAVSVQEKIKLDQHYVKEFHSLFDGKWNHMMESAHMGFRSWDDNDWTYPTISYVTPISYPKIAVSFRGDNNYNLGHHWQDGAPIRNSEMMRPDVDEITLDIDSRGNVDFDFQILCDKSWLSLSQVYGKSHLIDQPRISIGIKCSRSSIVGNEIAQLTINFAFENGEKKQAFVNVEASGSNPDFYPGVFVETQNYICIHAEHYSAKRDIEGMGWQVVPRLGRTDGAIKSFPVLKNWEHEDNRPFVQYSFALNKTQMYVISFYLSPRNPSVKGGTMKGCFNINENVPQLFDVVEKNYYAEWFCEEWSYGVTNNIRIVNVEAYLKEGLNGLNFYALDSNVILEKIVIYQKDVPIRPTHLAPPESYRIPLK